jgi:MtrB/PioB family decaheme-associated outer membrane protein
MRRFERPGVVLMLAVALIVGRAAVAADEPAKDQPKPEELKTDAGETDAAVEGEIIFGPQYYAATDRRDSKKFEEYRDVPNGFVVEWFAFHWRPAERMFFDLTVNDVTQRDQRLLFQVGKQDLWRGTVTFSENPREWTDQAYQLFALSSPGLFTLEDSFQAAVRAAPASVDANGDGEWDPGTKGYIIKNGIAQSAQSVEVGHQRKVLGAELLYTPGRNWNLSIAGDREWRRGTAPQTLGMYFSQAPAEVAAPIDFRTDLITGVAEYVAPSWNAGMRFAHTSFDNAYPSLRWDDQLFLVDEAVNVNQANPGRMQMSQPVNFDADQVFLFGGVNLRGRTRIDASVSVGRTTQDAAFLPMTINTLLTAAPLPASSYDGEHKTTTARLFVSSRPTKNFRWNAWYRLYDLDNKSPSLTFTDYVAADYQFPLCGNINVCDTNGNGIADDRISRRSLPYSFKRESLGALAGWAPIRWFNGALSFERLRQTRGFSAVTRSDEDILKLTLDFDVASWLTVRTTLRHLERTADQYDAAYFEASFPTGESAEAEANEGMRRYYWTDRDRDAYELQLDITPTEKLSFYAEAAYADDKYKDPNTGLKIGQSYAASEDRNFDGIPETYDILLAGRTDDKSQSYSVGFAYAASDRFHVYADYTWDAFAYNLETRYRNVTGGIGTDDPLDNWGSDIHDHYDTATFGLDYGLKADHAMWLALDASWSKGTGETGTHFVVGGASSGDTPLTEFPKLDTTLALVHASFNHKITKKLGYAFRYWYESWNEQNFASDYNQPYMGDPNNDPGSDRSIFLGLDFKNYTNNIVSFMLDYTF